MANYNEGNNYSSIALSTVSHTCQCSQSSTWDGTNWSSATNTNTAVTINGDYNTNIDGNFVACSLTINAGFRLTVGNSTYVEIENDVSVDGKIIVESQGSFVQNSDASLFTLNSGGSSVVRKSTTPLNNWCDYTYWSSPKIDRNSSEFY